MTPTLISALLRPPFEAYRNGWYINRRWLMLVVGLLAVAVVVAIGGQQQRRPPPV